MLGKGMVAGLVEGFLRELFVHFYFGRAVLGQEGLVYGGRVLSLF